MKHKHLLSLLIETFCKPESVGVEIGVDHADTTTYLLDNCSVMSYLYAVDPYVNRNERYDIIKKTLSAYDNCELMRMTSHDASSLIPDNTLDFIFIDGDHSYSAVRSDLLDYVPKIKPGGLLTGHDWTCIKPGYGIVEACEEFLIANSQLFQPLFDNDELILKGLSDFRRGGWCEKVKRHLIHKKYPSSFPFWWLIKL